MRFVKVKKFKLMDIGKTRNGLEITEKAVINAIKSFDGAPIIDNTNQALDDYRDDETVNLFYKSSCVGVVLPETVFIEDGCVYGDVMLEEDFVNRKDGYDNWLIQYDSGNLTYRECELF